MSNQALNIGRVCHKEKCVRVLGDFVEFILFFHRWHAVHVVGFEVASVHDVAVWCFNNDTHRVGDGALLQRNEPEVAHSDTVVFFNDANIERWV